MNIEKNKLTRAEFLKIVLPIQGWVARCDNLLFDNVDFQVVKRTHESMGISFTLTYFPINSPDFMEHGNSHICLYQFHSKVELLKRKEQIKHFLKAKTQEELDRYLKEFDAAY